MNSEKKVVAYQVVCVNSTKEGNPLAKPPFPGVALFSEKLWGDGWQPWGSPFVKGVDMLQAFVKYES